MKHQSGPIFLQSLKTVFVSTAQYCEGSSPIRAFATKKEAQDHCKACYDYDRTCPTPPDKIEDTPENDRLYDRWWKKRERWQKKHPAGANNANAQSYVAIEIPFGP